MMRLASKAHVAGQRHSIAEIAIKLVPIALVLGAMCFNFALCFISTNIVTIKPSVVILSEMVIVSLAFLASLRLLNQKYFVIIAATILYILILSVVRLIVSPENGFDIKIVRDFLIPIAFFMLGQSVKDLRLVDVAIKCTSIVVLAFAAFEYFSLATYLKYFDVIGYYIARGTVAEFKTSLPCGKRPNVQRVAAAGAGACSTSIFGRLSSFIHFSGADKFWIFWCHSYIVGLREIAD